MSGKADLQTAKAEDTSARSLVGRVVSNSMNKTAVVAIERKTAHPVYGKYMVRTSKYYVHDENNNLNAGDLVRIIATRPLSKLKRWVLGEVIEVANT